MRDKRRWYVHPGAVFGLTWILLSATTNDTIKAIPIAIIFTMIAWGVTVVVEP